jgi:GTP cyclohydrolase I
VAAPRRPDRAARPRRPAGAAQAARAGGRGAPPPSAALARAVADFLDALGLPPEVRRGRDLRGTPARVAEAWREDLLDGYGRDPAALLAETMPSAGRELVAVTAIDFHSICPHHLLPSRGLAHLAYVPGGRVVGFGQLARLVDGLAHRLVLQEDLARHVVEALMEHLGARGAACVLEAEQMCLSVRGEKRARALAHAQCFAGVLETDGALQRRFLAALERGAGRPAGRRRRGG